jgi:hypothetical protein
MGEQRTSDDYMESLREQERKLVEVLEEIKDSYMRAAEPYARRLQALRDVMNPPRVIVTIEQARAMGVEV